MTLLSARPSVTLASHRRWRSVIAAIVVAAGLGAIVTAVVLQRQGGTDCRVRSDGAPRCGAWWGAALNTPNSGLPAAVSARETATSRRLDIVHTYHRWFDTFPTKQEINVADSGHQLFLNWEPVDRAGRAMSWASIAAGKQDYQLDQTARRLGALGRPVFVSFSHEPEQNYPSHGSATDFAAAFRHVVKRTRAQGAENVRWVWNVMGLSDPTWLGRYAAMWPGDDVVDWVAWDPYNWAACRNRAWTTFAQMVEPFYGWLKANRRGNKPFMLAEYGTVEDPNSAGAKADWFGGIPLALKQFPSLRALVYFDYPAPPANCDWRIDTSSISQRGFTDLSQSAPFSKTAGLRLN